MDRRGGLVQKSLIESPPQYEALDSKGRKYSIYSFIVLYCFKKITANFSRKLPYPILIITHHSFLISLLVWCYTKVIFFYFQLFQMFSSSARILASRLAVRAVNTTTFSALRHPQNLRYFAAQVRKYKSMDDNKYQRFILIQLMIHVSIF